MFTSMTMTLHPASLARAIACCALTGLAALLPQAHAQTTDEVLSPPLLPSAGWEYKGNKAAISDYRSVAALKAGINQLRRNEEAIFGLCPNAIADSALPDQATWDRYSTDQKALFIVNDERRARGGVVYPKTISPSTENGPRGPVRGYPFSGVPDFVDEAAQWWTDYLRDKNDMKIKHCLDTAPANRRCPSERISDFGGKCLAPKGGLECLFAVSGGNNSNDTAIIMALLSFTYGTTGHRTGVLSQGYQDDYGNKREEGYVGFGVSHKNGASVVAYKMGDTASDAHMAANGNCKYNFKAKTSDLPGCTRFLEATYPKGPKAIMAGGDFTVTWNSSPCYQSTPGLSNIAIRLSLDGGATWPHTLAASVPVADGVKTVRIPSGVNTTAAVIKIESTGTSCHYFSDVVIAPDAPVVGVDFDSPKGNSPAHWKKLTTPMGQTLTDLPLDDGTPTGIDLVVNASACGVGGCAFDWNKAGDKLPRHIQSLKEAGGAAVARGNLEASFQGLTANAQYRVFVLATPLFGDLDQKVVITGKESVQFAQKAGGYTLMVNDNSGTLPLAAYGKVVTARPDGTISIAITPGKPNGEMMLAGLAIQSVSGSYPRPDGKPTGSASAPAASSAKP